jgi:hypothetical protein
MPPKRLKSRLLSKKAAKELLAQSEWVLDKALTERLKGLLRSPTKKSIYAHPDGRIFDFFHLDDRGRLYSTREDFFEMLEKIEEMNRNPRAHHVLEGIFPYGKDFPEHVSKLVELLSQKFKIPFEELDKTVSSLLKVEDAIRKYGKRKSLELPMFPAIVAYVGEVMCTQTNGKWDMRLVQDGTTWEPWIIDPEGRSCNPFVIVYDELYEQTPFSITGSASAIIKMRRVLPKPNKQADTIVLYLPSSPTQDPPK